MQPINHSPRLLAAPLLAGLLTACGTSSVVVQGSYPAPNINPLPLRVAVHYDDALRGHRYTEFNERGREEFTVASGQSHIRLFNAVLPAMFAEVVQVGAVEEAAALEVDAVFAPAIDEFQLGLPSKTMLGVYEVWVQYNMRLLTPEGELIADWLARAYGKTPQQNFRSSEASIEQAAIVALRDLASTFALRFEQVPEVRDWLAERQ